MKVLSACLCALFLLSAHSFAADFRSFNWGATKKQVLAGEKGKPVYTRPDAFGYLSELGGIKMRVMYQFENGKLVAGAYTNTSIHLNKNDFIEDYEKLKALLEKKYGKANQDEAEWKGDLYKEDPQHWGMAIVMGQLEYSALWFTDRTLIGTSLAGSNFSVDHTISYMDIKYVDKYRTAREKKALDAL